MDGVNPHIRESPDSIWATTQSGLETRLAGCSDLDSITFTLSDGVQLWGQTSPDDWNKNRVVHGTIQSLLEKLGANDITGLHENEIEYLINACLKKESINFKGDQSKLIALANHVSKNNIYARDIGITGHIWTDTGYISFWRPKAKVLQHIDWIEHFANGTLHEDLYDYKFDFEDRAQDAPLRTLKYLKSAPTDDDKKLSQNDISALRAQAHVDPKAAEKLKQAGIGKATNSKRSDQAKKAGYNSVAAYHHARQVGDSIIKLGSLLESPDVVRSSQGNVDSLSARKEITFGLWNDFCLYGNNTDDFMTHFTIWQTMVRLKTESLSKVLATTPNVKFIGNEKSAYFEASHTSTNHNDQRSAAVLNGRLWTEDKIVSFWERQEVVAKHFHLIDKFLENFGSVNEYRFDFVDRINKPNVPLVSSDEVQSSSNSSKLSDKEIAHLKSQAHIDPNAEKKLVSLGLGGKLKTKQSDLKSKLKASTSDGIIKLGDLLK
jgi:hypothetical protein